MTRGPAGGGSTEAAPAFRALVEASSDLLLLLSADGTVRFQGPAFARALGWSEGESEGSPLEDRVHPEDRAAVVAVLETLRTEPAGRVPLEVRLQDAGGAWRVVRGHGSNLLDLPGVEAVVVAARDVTARRRARAEAERAHARLIAILDTITEAVLLVRPDGTIAFANQASRQILGREPGELLGQRFSELPWRALGSDGPGAESPETPVADLLAAPHALHDVRLRVEREGQNAFLAASAAPLRDLEEETVGVVVSFRDETERVRASRALRHLNAELEQRVEERTAELTAANEELEAFAYSVSHDLRAPLRALDGFSQALAEDYEDRLDGEALDFLARIRANAQRMARLIDDILQLSRVSRKGMARAPVDVAGVVREVVEVLRQGEPHRSVELVLESDQLPVEGDPKLVRVAVQNLVENAWKFTEPRSEARIEVGSRMEDGRRWVEIRDNGVGFEMEYADKLFKAFHRLHRDSEFDGTGIGLATVRRIVRRHGGEVRAEGAAGEGATLAFTLERRAGP